MAEKEEDNIDFGKIWTILKKEKWMIFGIILLFGILGLIYSFSLQEEFVSEGKILPEVQSKGGGMGQFAGLAALAGLDLGSGGGGDAIRPDLYPDILKSTPFFLSLLKMEFNTKNNVKRKIEYFLDDKNEDSNKIKYPLNKNYIVFSKKTGDLIKELKSRIICNYDKKSGVILISTKMPDPVLAAEVTNSSMQYLTNYMINYRTEKQKQDLNFIAERLAAAKGKYFSNQERKASYTDQMPLSALRMQSADLARERIDADYKISANFYNTLLQKYEEAKLKMQQETPVIKILEPAVVPNLKSEPKKGLIVLGFLFMGVLFSILFVFIKGNKDQNR